LAQRPICGIPGFALLFEVMARPWIDAKPVAATIGAIVSRPTLG
jgi:hypothetical protein